jgi:hypothetical protein
MNYFQNLPRDLTFNGVYRSNHIISMKSILSISLLFLIVVQSNAQTFYDLSTIQTIEIVFAQSNWDALLDAEKAGDENYIMAQSVTINGVMFDSVGVKYKGNSTYNANQVKNPLHIELDTYKDHIYENYTDIKLSNVAKDPSFLREVLSYQILRQYMKAPLSNYANVYINGNLMGLYSNSESIGKKFVNKYFYSKTNTRVKCNPPEGAGPQSNDLPTLEYLGADSANYAAAYEMKSDAGWDELIDLCDTLNNHISEIEQILDVDRALWMIAFDNMLVNLDSYIGGFAQNYYLYRDDNGRFNPIVWDLNESFGQFSMTGSITLNNTTAKQQMTHLLHENDANYPLISKLLSIPIYKRMYLAHCKTILEENFDNGSYIATAQTFQTLIDADVQADPNKFYTYANFISNINSDINSGGGPQAGTTPGITNLMNARASYLLGLSDFTNTQPTISNVTVSSSTPALNETVTITATLSDENMVYVGTRDDITKAFERSLMYDDGAHNDGAANDGVYGADVEVTSGQIQYYVYAENNQAGKFSPARAEHEYYTLNATWSINGLVINEFMADNDNVIADGTGSFEDWIEIYNNSSASISLSDYYLTDDATDPGQFQLPNDTIPAFGFKLIWASDEGTRGDDHANFKLSKNGEEVGLYFDNGTDFEEIDYILYGGQNTNVSYGRAYDAAPTWVFFETPTPEASNGQVGVELVEVETLTMFPNPYQFAIHIENPSNENQVITVFNTMGQMLDQLNVEPFGTLLWEDQFANGVRIFVVESESSKQVIKAVKR